MLAGCDSGGVVDVAPEPEEEISPFAGFNLAFRPYVQRFVEEAEARGVRVDVRNLTIEFVSEINRGGRAYCGYALNFGTANPPHVEISLQDGCWNGQKDLNKEILLFHELGHAILNRAHSHKKLPNGSWGSLMFDGRQFDLYTEHTLGKRTYYLDELFNENTPTPAWGRAKTNQEQLLLNTGFDTRDAAWSFVAVPSNNPNGYAGTWTDEHVVSPGYALRTNHEGELVDGGSFAYWRQTVSAPSYPLGARLSLKGEIRLNGIDGTGVALTVRANTTDSEAVLLFTTFNLLTITGSHDFTQYMLDIDYPEGFDSITVFLILTGNTTGTVYFDDVTLTAQY